MASSQFLRSCLREPAASSVPRGSGRLTGLRAARPAGLGQPSSLTARTAGCTAKPRVGKYNEKQTLLPTETASSQRQKTQKFISLLNKHSAPLRRRKSLLCVATDGATPCRVAFAAWNPGTSQAPVSPRPREVRRIFLHDYFSEIQLLGP